MVHGSEMVFLYPSDGVRNLMLYLQNYETISYKKQESKQKILNMVIKFKTTVHIGLIAQILNRKPRRPVHAAVVALAEPLLLATHQTTVLGCCIPRLQCLR